MSRIIAQKWIARSDARPSHKAADGQIVLIGEQFNVGGIPMRFPGDSLVPPEEFINCRCTIEFLTADDLLAEGIDVPKDDTGGRDYKPIPRSEWDIVQEDQSPRRVNKEEEDAAVSYKGIGFQFMNKIQRGQAEDFPDWQYNFYEKQISHVEALIDKTSGLREDSILYRGLSSNAAPVCKKMKPGTIFEEPAIMSTSMNTTHAKNFAEKDGFFVELRVPKGTKVLSLDSVVEGATKIKNEQELLFRPFSAWRVVSKKGRNIVMELISG